MPPHEPLLALSSLIDSRCNSDESLNTMKNDYTLELARKPYQSEYTQDELLSYAKCFTSDDTKEDTSQLQKLLNAITSFPSRLIRYGVLLPIRAAVLGATTVGFFICLPFAVAMKSNSTISTLVKFYCKGFMVSFGVKINYIGEKPELNEPHVFVSNHTSYLDYILLGAHRFPHAVVMAKHGGALVIGILQNYGLNYLHSMTFDRSNVMERKYLADNLKKHVHKEDTWKNPMIIFPEGTCVNNQYAIRFQKGAFELGVKVCPVGIKYNRSFGDPYWDTRKGFMYYAFYRMTRWQTPVEVVYCQPQSPIKGEDATSYGKRVKDVIADSIGLQKVDFNGMAKRELLNVLETQ
ncbi:hypothetical protein BDB01DRAFT_783416 [Pilobolus umbonatus]|nr:hypothetical protein BDB01DRAFT_783416 [Pilobolus umbonatus]